MKAVAYLRVSTDSQSEAGHGLRAQRDANRAWAKRSEFKRIAETFSDAGISGAAGLENRPALLEAVAALQAGDVLVVAKRDRLGRDPFVIAMIEAAVARQGAKIVSAAGEGTDGNAPGDVLMRRMVDAFAEYERLLIGARTKAALQAKIRRGERVGSLPYGFDLVGDGVQLVRNKREQRAIRLIGDLHESGLSLRKIAAELTRLGIRTKNGNAVWGHTAVNRILNRVPA
jgi:DNA invertase Pin-like site-specific DNA recombinase